MKQMIRVCQEIVRKKVLLLLTTIFLLSPTIACAQVISPPNEEGQTTPNVEKEDKTIIDLFGTPAPSLRLPTENPPYGTIVMLQKPIACNDTAVIKNFIENMGGMKPVTIGTDVNEMGAITSLVQVYANPVNKRFAIVEHFAAQKSCIIVQGQDFDIIIPSIGELY